MADETLEAFGQDVEPSTGNEIPPGSLPEEVKDDIPAMLSEGEYVVPADVLRFYGIKFFEDLRRQAKTELAMMERNGRVGGDPVELDGDEALPFAVAELRTVDVEDDDVAKANRGLYANINARKKAGTSRSKEDSTISKDAYAKMVAGFADGGVADYISEEEKDLISITPSKRPTLVEFVNEAGDVSYHRRMPSQDGGFVYVPPVPETYRLKAEVDAENSVVTPVEDKGDGAYDDQGNWTGAGSEVKALNDMTLSEYIDYKTDVLSPGINGGVIANFFSKYTLPGMVGTALGKRNIDKFENSSQYKDMLEQATKQAYSSGANAAEGQSGLNYSDQGDINAVAGGIDSSGFGSNQDFSKDSSVSVTKDKDDNEMGMIFNQGGLAMKKSKKTYGKGYNKGGAVKGYTTTKKPKYSKGGLASKKKKM